MQKLGGGIPTNNIISYWKLNANSNDSVGSNDGTDNLISYVAGGVTGFCAYFTSYSNSSIIPTNLVTGI